MRHELATVTDAENGNTPIENLRINVRRFFQINTVGATGEDNTNGVERLELFQRSGAGLNFAVDTAFTDSASNKLVVLTTEVNYDKITYNDLSNKIFAEIYQ